MSMTPQHAFAPSPMMHAPTPSRKRHAVDPPLFDSPDKRRRPNLAYGFSGLSLSNVSPFSVPPPPDATHVDEDDEGHSPLGADDVAVEEVDTPSSPSSVSTVDSDATFRDTRRIRRKRTTLHPDSIEQPMDEPLPVDMDVQDITTRPKKRRDDSEEENVEGHAGKRRRTDDMDLDMDEDVEEIPRRTRPRTRTEWHEPEKDRELTQRLDSEHSSCSGIIITSLGSPNSSRDSSRESSPSNHDRHLSQPGEQGFTLNPSLLTHLLNSQRDNIHLPAYPPQERGLVLYRPLGIEPGTGRPSVVQEWQGEPPIDDTGRFEMIDEDEPVEQVWQGDDDMAMDIE